MKIPRDLSGADLIARLTKLGYRPTHRGSSHARLTTMMGGEHHVTVPLHDFIKIGTLNAILKDVASHAGLTREELIRRIL